MNAQSAKEIWSSKLSIEPIQVELGKLKLSPLIPASIRDAVVQPTACQMRMTASCAELLRIEAICAPPLVAKQNSRASRFDVIGNFHTFNLLRAKHPPEARITVMSIKANAETIAELISLEVLRNRIIPASLPVSELFRLLQALFPNEAGESKHLIKRASFKKLFPGISTRQQLALVLNIANSQLSHLTAEEVSYD